MTAASGPARPGRGTPAVTVIVPTYNRVQTLLAALDCLAGQTVGPAELEVIVSDDGSTDDTAAEVAGRQWPFPLTYLRQANAGPAAARNQALRRAAAPLTLFVNDDTLLAAGAVEQHLAMHERLAGQRLMVLGSFDLKESFLATRLGHLLQHTPYLFQFCMLEPGDVADHNFAYTCNLSLPTAAARAAGFDEEFRGPAGEDIDFGRRVGKQGWGVYYHPAAAARHDHDMTVRSLCRTARTRGRGQATYYRKHGFNRPYLQRTARLLAGFDPIDERMEPTVRLLERHVENVPWSAAAPLPDELYAHFAQLFVVYEAAGLFEDPAIRAAAADGRAA